MSHHSLSHETRDYNQARHLWMSVMETGQWQTCGGDGMVCEPHRYLMARVAGYNPVSLPSIDYGISTRYNARSRMEYQGSDALLSGGNGSVRYQSIEKEQYQFTPQKQYDFGSVQSPAIGVVRPVRRSQGRESKSDHNHIDSLPVIKQASGIAPTASSPYHGLNALHDYSMQASHIHQKGFEMQKQSLARTIMAELAQIESQKAALVQMN